MAPKPLSSKLLLALTSAALAVPSLAYAQVKAPELQFYPSQGWDVSVDSGVCQTSTVFNNGFILNLGGSDAWVETLSVDFRQSIFTPGKAYSVSLSVPGVAQNKFKARAVGSNILSLSMKDSKPLYKALRTNAVLDMNVEANAFRFIMTGFTQAAAQFERCMAGGALEAKPKDGVREANAADQQQGLVASASQLNEQALAQVQDTTEALLSRADGSNFMENEAMAMEEKAMDKPVAIAEILPDNSEPVVQKLPYTETTKLKDTVVEAKKVVPGEPDVAPEPILKAEVNATEAVGDAVSKTVRSNKRMSDILAEEIRRNPSIVEMGGGAIPLNRTPNKRVAALEMPPEIETFSPLPDSAETEVADVMLPDADSTPPRILEEPESPEVEVRDVPALDAVEPNGTPKPMNAPEKKPEPVVPIGQDVQIAKVKTQPMKMRKEVIKAEADFTHLEPAASAGNQELRDQIFDLQAQLDVLKAENRALNDDLSVTLKQSEDERMSISSENWNLERATMRYNEAERQIKRLGQQLQRERAKCQAEQQDLEAMLFDPQVTNEQQLARLADLENQLMKAKSDLQDQRLIYEERIQTLEGQLGR